MQPDFVQEIRTGHSSEPVLRMANASASNYGVEILRADVKDLVFPGNLREIMKQILETERRIEALQAMADGGGRFVVGLKADGLGVLFAVEG